jgi:hypothetical protein
MSRSEDDDKLDRIAKYKIFKRAFDTVSFFVESGNIVGGFVLSFSILEDRMKAAMVDCFKAIGEPIGSNEVSKIPYGKVVSRLKRVKAIDDSLGQRLMDAADLRNTLTHQMMWRLDVFKVEHIEQFLQLITDLKRAHRAFVRLNKSR